MVSILTAWCTMEPLMKEPVVCSLTALFWGGLLSGVPLYSTSSHHSGEYLYGLTCTQLPAVVKNDVS